MITIYKTKTMADAADYVMDALSRVDKTNLDVMHTVIVPDRASLEAERMLLKRLGGSFNVQVRTFRRLASDVLPKYDYLSKQSGIMALSCIIRDNRSKLTCFTKGVDTPGFVESVYDTLCMMKYCRITPAMLARELPKSVGGKARDIALLYEAYLEYTKDRFIDSADKMDLLCQALAQTDVAANSYYYLFDFDNFSAQELAIVQQLMAKSRGVMVACCASNTPGDGRLYLNDIFNSVLALCREQERLAGQHYTVVEGCRYANAYAKQIGEGLFRNREVQSMPSNGFVQVFAGATRYNEVYALACRVQNYVRSGGRYRDVYVVASDVAKYTNAISALFDEFGIPYFCDRQYVLADHLYARFVVDYLQLCRSNGKLSTVLPFVKNCLYCGFDDADTSVFAFENYCLKYNISYRYDGFSLGREELFFDQANAFRARFNELYNTLKAPNSATVAQYVQFVRELLQRVDLPGRAEELAAAQAKEGFAFESKVTLQVADKLESVLVQAERVMGDRLVKTEEFVRLLTAGLTSVKISVIPVYGDCVIFANMAKARKHDVKLLALLGANQGAMPIVKSDTKLLSDRNVRDLCDAGLNVEPMIFTENRRERFSLFQLLMEPTDGLYVSYAAADGADSLLPSPFVKELRSLFGERGKPLPLCSEDDNVYTERQAIGKLVQLDRMLKDNRPVATPCYGALKQLYADKAARYEFVKDGTVTVCRGKELYLKKSATSVSQLTDFFKCPYRFYIQYGLNVKPRTVAELQSSDLGNVLHAVLEMYVRDVDVEETDQATEQKAKDLFEEALKDDFYRGLRSDVKMTGVLSQLKAESVRMCKVVKVQLRNSDFSNLATEQEFGEGKDMPPVVVDFDGGSFALVGKIDRVDVCGDRFLVIDYKSGAKAAEYRESELYIGHKLQLPVYVKAVRDATGKRPAGFYYFPMHDTFAELGSGEDYVYNGRTLMDVTVATQIDRTLAAGKSEKLGLKLNTKGGFDMRTGRTRLLTDEQFDNQIEYTFRLIRRAGNLMKQGYANVTPYVKVCSYCDYKDICDFGDTLTYNARKVEDKVDKTCIDEVIRNGKK